MNVKSVKAMINAMIRGVGYEQADGAKDQSVLCTKLQTLNDMMREIESVEQMEADTGINFDR